MMCDHTNYNVNYEYYLYNLELSNCNCYNYVIGWLSQFRSICIYVCVQSDVYGMHIIDYMYNRYYLWNCIYTVYCITIYIDSIISISLNTELFLIVSLCIHVSDLCFFSILRFERHIFKMSCKAEKQQKLQK